jgi:hypothetical protein
MTDTAPVLRAVYGIESLIKSTIISSYQKPTQRAKKIRPKSRIAFDGKAHTHK